MNRKQFIQSKGATCRNWNWSWSFVNKDERFVIFGAWEDESCIFSEDWEINPKGARSKGFKQSLEHIDLVLSKGYRLFTFPMTRGEDSEGISKIESFEPELSEKFLVKFDGDWHAMDSADNAGSPDELPPSPSFPEGGKRLVQINAYERNPRARAACLQHHGHRCAVCDFDFEGTYGEIGHKFIHVHHITPLKDIASEYEVDPINDLVPVCPNCHAMIHRTEPCQSIDQLRGLLRSQQSKSVSI